MTIAEKDIALLRRRAEYLESLPDGEKNSFDKSEIASLRRSIERLENVKDA